MATLSGAEHRLGFKTLAGVTQRLKELKAQPFNRNLFMGKIHDGTRFLLREFNFKPFGSKKKTSDNEFQYSTTTSPNFPNSTILRIEKLKTPVFIHDVTFIKFPNGVIEYYNPNGKTHGELPEEIQNFISEDGRYKIKAYNETIAHQDNDAICTRHSLVRDYYSDLNNKEYHTEIIRQKDANRLPTTADVIWNKTQNTLADKGQLTKVIRGAGKYCKKCHGYK
jgi:hypothetical protein